MVLEKIAWVSQRYQLKKAAKHLLKIVIFDETVTANVLSLSPVYVEGLVMMQGQKKVPTVQNTFALTQ